MQQDYLFCEKCGTRNGIHDTYCVNCGALLSPIVDPMAETIVAGPAQQELMAAMEQQQEPYRPQPYIPPEEPPKKRKLWLIPVILLILAGLGVGGWFVYQNFFSSTTVNLTKNLDSGDLVVSGGEGDCTVYIDASEARKKADSDKDSEKVKEFIDTVYYEVEPDTDLYNGDKVVVIATYDEDMAEDLHITVKGASKTLTVSGIGESSKDDRDKDEEDKDKDSASLDHEYTMDDKLLTEEDLKGKSADDIQLMINEIYARHGYIFTKEKKYNDIFEKTDWYQGDTTDMDEVQSRLNRTELDNLDFLVKHR